MMRPHRLQVSDRATRLGIPLLTAGGLLLGSTMFSPLAMAQPPGQTASLDKGQTASLDKVRVVSTETYQFPLTTSSDKKVITVPALAEGRTLSGEILCNMQTQAELHNWYPFRYYMYKQVGGQLSLIKGGGLGASKYTISYTATKADASSNAKYVISAHLNHAQVTGQCSLTVKVTELVHVAPQQMKPMPSLDSPQLKRIPRPPSE